MNDKPKNPHAQALGKLGRRVCSEAQANASRINGKKPKHKIEDLKEQILCAVNALTDSILVSGNDAKTNMHFVRKLKELAQ